MRVDERGDERAEAVNIERAVTTEESLWESAVLEDAPRVVDGELSVLDATVDKVHEGEDAVK